MTDAERRTVKVNAIHLTEVQTLAKQQLIDIAFISVKSYDTVWAASSIHHISRRADVRFRCRIASMKSEWRVSWDGAASWAVSSPAVWASICAEPGHIRRGYAKGRR